MAESSESHLPLNVTLTRGSNVFFSVQSSLSVWYFSTRIQIQSHLLELQLNVTLWMKAQHHLSTNGNKQLTDPFVDSHPVGLLVALITVENNF